MLTCYFTMFLEILQSLAKRRPFEYECETDELLAIGANSCELAAYSFVRQF